MKSIAVTGPSGSLHDLDYEYDGYGNLNYQTTTIGAAVSTEGFFYDALHRLTQSSRSYPSGSKTVNYAYDPSGNLTLKDDYATSYTYSTTTRPNAVTSITKVGGGSVTFSYDANGNLTSGDGKSLTYTAFNKPRTITAGGITATFHYGADLARYRQEKTNGETTLYIDKLMEIVSVRASTDYRHYLGENAILTKIDSLSDPYPSVKFVLRDRLGSVVTLSDETGTNPERRGYDPFGKPRDGDWAEKTPPTIGSGTTDRGFTDHEHLDESRLIHMNGRAYDYQLGRFLSVDPFIQEPGNSQSLNPYSYIMNNPLAGTDPSGYCKSSTRIQGGSSVGCQIHLADSGQGNSQAARQTSQVSASNGASTDQRSNASGSNAGTSAGEVNELGSQGGQGEFGSVHERADISDINSQASEYVESSFLGFIQEEGLDVLLRTGQSVGGAGQVLLGGAICYGSGTTACAAGIAIAAKGLDNFQAGITGEQSIAEEALANLTGSETAGVIVNAGLDLGTSVYGLVRAVPIVRELGTKGTAGVQLFRPSPIDTEPSFRQATTFGLSIGAATDLATIADASAEDR